MKRQILFGILFLLFTKLWAQDQDGKDYFFGDNFHFHGYRTDLRMMIYSTVTFQISDKRISSIFESFDSSHRFNSGFMRITPKSKILLGIKLTQQYVTERSNQDVLLNGCIRGLHRILGGDIAVPGLKLKRKVLMWDGTWCGVCGVRKIFGFRRGNGRSRKPWRIPLPGWSQQHVRMMCGRWISSSIRTITAGQSRSAT